MHKKPLNRILRRQLCVNFFLFYCVSRRVFFLLCYFRRKYKSSSFLQSCLIMLNQNTPHIYSEPGQVHLAYVVSVIDYNISLFRTASRSNYAIIDYTVLQSPGIWNFPLASKTYYSYSLDFHTWLCLLSLFLCMEFSTRQ